MRREKRRLDPDRLYGRIAHYYMVRKNRSRDEANRIARNVVSREISKHRCSGEGCGHAPLDHVGARGACMFSGCACGAFAPGRP